MPCNQEGTMANPFSSPWLGSSLLLPWWCQWCLCVFACLSVCVHTLCSTITLSRHSMGRRSGWWFSHIGPSLSLHAPLEMRAAHPRLFPTRKLECPVLPSFSMLHTYCCPASQIETSLVPSSLPIRARSDTIQRVMGVGGSQGDFAALRRKIV